MDTDVLMIKIITIAATIKTIIKSNLEKYLRQQKSFSPMPCLIHHMTKGEKSGRTQSAIGLCETPVIGGLVLCALFPTPAHPEISIPIPLLCSTTVLYPFCKELLRHNWRSKQTNTTIKEKFEFASKCSCFHGDDNDDHTDQELENRLRARGTETEESLAKRLGAAAQEMA